MYIFTHNLVCKHRWNGPIDLFMIIANKKEGRKTKVGKERKEPQ